MALMDKIKRLKLFEYLNIDKSLNSYNLPRAPVEKGENFFFWKRFAKNYAETFMASIL